MEDLQNPSQQPVPQNPPSTASAPAPAGVANMANINRAAITGIILGSAMILLGLIVGLTVESALLINVVIGAVVLAFSFKLRQAHKAQQIAQIVSNIKVLSITVAGGLLLSLLFGGGPGFLVILLLVFLVLSSRDLHKAGLTTSASPIVAKVK